MENENLEVYNPEDEDELLYIEGCILPRNEDEFASEVTFKLFISNSNSIKECICEFEAETIVTFMPIDISSEISTEYKDITSLEKYKNTISYTTDLNMLLKNNKSVTFQKINRLHKLP